MAGFTSVDNGGIHVHAYTTERFKTRHVHIKFVRPLSRDSVTAAALLPYLWMEGTQQYPSARALMERADDLYGASIRASVGKRGDQHIVETYAGVPDEQALRGATGLFQQAQTLAAELCTRPFIENGAFPAQHVDRERSLHKKRIESLFDDKIAWSMDRCLDSVYQGERFALPRLGYVDDLEGLTGDGLWETHQALLEQADVHVYLVGHVGEPSEAAKSILHLLSERLPARPEARDVTRVQALGQRDGEVRHVVDAQQVRQGKLNLGFRTGLSYADGEYPAMLVCNGILGGFPHSKLFVNVREKASLAYYASSRLDGLTGVLAVQTGIEIDNYERALEIIKDQVRAIQEGQISDKELSFTKRGLRNQYLQANDQPMSLIDLHFAGVLAGKPRELTQLLDGIEAVTKEDVIRAAQAISLDTVYFLRNEVRADA